MLNLIILTPWVRSRSAVTPESVCCNLFIFVHQQAATTPRDTVILLGRLELDYYPISSSSVDGGSDDLMEQMETNNKHIDSK